MHNRRQQSETSDASSKVSSAEDRSSREENLSHSRILINRQQQVEHGAQRANARADTPLAETRDGVSRFSSSLNGLEFEPHVRAHEAVHAMQHRVWLAGEEAGTREQLEAEAEIGAAEITAGRDYMPRFGGPQGLTLYYDTFVPNVEQSVESEQRSLSVLGEGATESARIELETRDSEDYSTGNQSRHYSLRTTAGGDQGSMDSSTDIWLTLDFTDPMTGVLRPVARTPDPELGLGTPYDVPAYPVNITYVRVIQHSDSDGRTATATVRGSVHFSLETWFERTESREINIETLVGLLGDDGTAEVEFEGRGPVQGYLQNFAVAGNSLEVQMDKAALELRSGGILPIRSDVTPTFIQPNRTTGEQFENLHAFLESADLIELMRRIRLEWERASQERSWIERLGDSIGDWLAENLGGLADAVSDLWNSLPAPVRGILRALGKAGLVLAGVAALAGLVVLVTEGAVAFGTAMLVIGAIMLAAGFVYSVYSRSMEVAEYGEWWQIPFIPLVAALDAVGLAPFIEALTDHSILTGRDYGRDPEARWESGTLGLIQMIATFFGARAILRGRVGVGPGETPGRGGAGETTVETPVRGGTGETPVETPGRIRGAEGIEVPERVAVEPIEPAPFEPTPAARALARSEGLPLDEATALAETAGRTTTDPHGARIIGEDAIARFFGVNRNQYHLPESIMQMRNGRYILTEVKNQRFADIGNALAKFRDVIGLMRGRAGEFRIGRLELYVSRSRFEGFTDAQFSVGRGGILLYNGRPYFIDSAPGVPIRVIFRELGPPIE